MDNHYITIENRERITVSKVSDVDAFDEEMLWANLTEGGLEITGEKLNIQKLDLEEGMLVVTGKINSVNYTDKGHIGKKGLLKKLTGRADK